MKLRVNIFLICVFIGNGFGNENIIEDYKDMFEKAFNYVNKGYVDSIDHPELLISGIKGMLKPLDPYTKVVIGSSKERLDMLTKGKYGGVGIRIGSLRDTLTILSPMEDSPAYTEGIKSGDQIMKIDSINAIGMTTKEASKIIKGELGSEVILHVRRPGHKKRYAFNLIRSNISVKDVPYWNIDKDGFGYIRITRFSRNTYEDFLKALAQIDSEKFTDSNGNGKWDKSENYRDSNSNNKRDLDEKFVDINRNNQWDPAEQFIDLNSNGKWDREGVLKGLIIDLRGNSGGLLREATSILNSLIRKGENLLFTKGRGGKVLRKYRSTSDPVLSEDVPIIVLVNKSSASASEIIAGVIQDLDRGVIMGSTTFGKGLVQQIKTLNDTISLKVTNAKYYIPSGRLIQKQDWLKDGYLTDGLNVKDSTFYTVNMGRIVHGGGGVKPDLKTDIEKAPAFINMLWKKGLFLSFSAQYIAKNNIDKSNFNISDQIIKDFEDFCDKIDDDLDYLLPGEKELKSMKKVLKISSDKSNQKMFSIFRESSDAYRYVGKMEKHFKKQKDKQFKNMDNKKWLVNGLEKEFSRILLGERDRIGVSLKIDSEYDEAIKILKNIRLYDSILGIDSPEAEKDY